MGNRIFATFASATISVTTEDGFTYTAELIEPRGSLILENELTSLPSEDGWARHAPTGRKVVHVSLHGMSTRTERIAVDAPTGDS